MIDEIYSRHWNDGHEAFTADIDRLFRKLREFASGQARRAGDIDSAYGRTVRGAAASLMSLTLFVTVGLLAMPDALPASASASGVAVSYATAPILA